MAKKKKAKAGKSKAPGNKGMGEFIINAVKGIGIGIANVIPGVSGGTIAFITGIFERLVNAIKSFDVAAVRLLMKWKIKDLLAHVDFNFLAAVFTGMVIAILSFARLFDFLFAKYPVYIWAYFFGLIMASVYYVGRTVKKWTPAVIAWFVAGTAFAVALSVVSPGVKNDNVFYVFLCGMISIIAMILPGISGSFVLLLMGNYEYIVIKSVNSLDLGVLIPFALGCAVGLIAFSHLLSLLLKKFHNATVSSLTGFVLGSLVMIWPWKETVYLKDAAGQIIVKKGEQVVLKYISVIPQSFSAEVIIAVILVALGIASIIITENMAAKK